MADERNIIVECQPCMFCGKSAEVVMPLSAAKAWQAGALLQQAWPEADDATRETLISGTHPECWEKYVRTAEEE